MRLLRDCRRCRDPSTAWPLRFRGAATALRMTVFSRDSLSAEGLAVSESWFVDGFAGLVGFVAGVDFVPVDYVPPGG